MSIFVRFYCDFLNIHQAGIHLLFHYSVNALCLWCHLRSMEAVHSVIEALKSVKEMLTV